MADSLDFTPVPRKCKRRDGWTAERQRGFIAALGQGLDPEKAAQTQGMTGNGAYQLRKAAGAESFAAAWDAAVEGAGGRAAAVDAKDTDDAEDPIVAAEEMDQLIAKYGLKLGQERRARLEGRIAEADFYCRQLTCIEVALCLGEAGFALMKSLRSGDYGVLDIAATAMSNHLEQVRRSIWREKGEADRPPPSLVAQLAVEDDEIGLPHSMAIQGGPDWREKMARQHEDRRIMAEAQRQWEERAAADAAAWAAREAAAHG